MSDAAQLGEFSCRTKRRTRCRCCFSIDRIRERAAVAGFNQQHVRFFGMGRANVQVVSTRAGLHSLAHRYGRTISVFTKVLSSDRIILNQYSIRGDALWYALPALSRCRMRILAAIHSPDAIGKILDCLGLPCRAPPISSAVPESMV